jgi:sugar/nucleoside kinase (ribokinase family)
MGTIWTMGELLVEIMRDKVGKGFEEMGVFLGPFPSGAPAIFIDTVVRLGHNGIIIGGIGQDGFGLNVLNRLKNHGVDCSYINVSEDKTTAVAFVTYFEDGSRQFIFYIDNTAAVEINISMLDKISKISNYPDYFHIMGCSLMINEEFRRSIFKVLEIFRTKGTKISFDPNIRIELLKNASLDEIINPILKNCSIFFPGEKELLLLTKEKEIKLAVSKLFDNIDDLKIIVLKKGKDGSDIYTRDKYIAIKPFNITEKDPTGAGDCFDAGFLCGLLEKKSLYDCGMIASAVGALNASAFGPMEGKISPKSVKELIKYGRVEL